MLIEFYFSSMTLVETFYLAKYTIAAKTKTAIPWNRTLIRINLLLYFLLKFPFLAIAITPITTINKASSIEAAKISGNIPEEFMVNSYQIIYKCLIIKYF